MLYLKSFNACVPMKVDPGFRTGSIQHFGERGVNGFVYPGEEASPGIFEMFADDLHQPQIKVGVPYSRNQRSSVARSML
jgi:hypothetical protein